MGNLFPRWHSNDDSHLQMTHPNLGKNSNLRHDTHKNRIRKLNLSRRRKKEKEFIKKKFSFYFFNESLNELFFLLVKMKIRSTFPWRNAVRRSYYAIERNFFSFFSIPDKVGCNRHRLCCYCCCSTVINKMVNKWDRRLSHSPFLLMNTDGHSTAGGIIE